MIIECDATIVRADLARWLINYKLQPEDRIGISLDVIEYISLRLRPLDDIDVFNLAVFVQRELDRFLKTRGNYPVVIGRLTAAAFAAKSGRVAFYQVISDPNLNFTPPLPCQAHRNNGIGDRAQCSRNLKCNATSQMR